MLSMEINSSSERSDDILVMQSPPPSPSPVVHTHKHTFVCIANGMAREKSISARTNLMKQTRSIETIDLNEFKMKPNNSAYIVHTIDYRPYSIQIHLCNILWMKKKINLHNDSSNWVTELNVIYDQFVGWPCMLIFIEISFVHMTTEQTEKMSEAMQHL